MRKPLLTILLPPRMIAVMSTMKPSLTYQKKNWPPIGLRGSHFIPRIAVQTALSHCLPIGIHVFTLGTLCPQVWWLNGRTWRSAPPVFISYCRTHCGFSCSFLFIFRTGLYFSYRGWRQYFFRLRVLSIIINVPTFTGVTMILTGFSIGMAPIRVGSPRVGHGDGGDHDAEQQRHADLQFHSEYPYK